MVRISLSRSAVSGLVLLVGAAALVSTGCSESKGNRVQGKVTFKGQPVASGKIYFNPDAAKKSEGMPGFATIKDGSYDTAAKGSQGVNGGAMLVRIEGLDASGKVIFVHTTNADLPASGSAKQDFDVPESAAANAPKETGPMP